MAYDLDPSRWLVISDLQIPFHHQHALEFCKYVQKHYRIPAENILCVGDETDGYFGGLWPKDPNGHHSAMSELQSSVEELRKWYQTFPEMRLAISNHGTRWLRKATQAEIPSIMLRRYEDVLEAPAGWRWQKTWRVPAKYPFMIEHGDAHGGQTPHKQAAMLNGISTAIGHFHSIAGVEYMKTNGMNVWGLCTGSLIDFEQYAFHYARDAKLKPQIGVGVVVDDGRWAQWIPL
jgi:hypothetical protein